LTRLFNLTATSIVSRVEPLARRAAQVAGCELLLVELCGAGHRSILRVTIDKPGGIAVADCQRVSGELSVILDVEDPMPASYELEVSSPGIDRPLVRPEDYQRFAGRRVRLKTFGPIDGQRNFRGRLEGLEGETVRLALEDQRYVAIPLSQVAKARLEIDLGPGLKPARG